VRDGIELEFFALEPLSAFDPSVDCSDARSDGAGLATGAVQLTLRICDSLSFAEDLVWFVYLRSSLRHRNEDDKITFRTSDAGREGRGGGRANKRDAFFDV
jgi:hypothetical protein